MLWFFRPSMLLKYNRAFAVFCRSYLAPPKCSVTLGTANAMALVGTSNSTADISGHFLQRNYVNYICTYAQNF